MLFRDSNLRKNHLDSAWLLPTSKSYCPSTLNTAEESQGTLITRDHCLQLTSRYNQTNYFRLRLFSQINEAQSTQRLLARLSLQKCGRQFDG